MSYKHITLEERICLEELRRKGKSIREIAQILGRAASTISRELKRNSCKKGYVPWYAYCQSKHRARKVRRKMLYSEPEKLFYVIEKLQEAWTPEQIAGRWNQERPDNRLSCSTIYRYINNKLLPGISKKVHLRRHGKKKIHRNSEYNTIHPDRRIPEWPEEIVKRMRIGDWEGDTLNGGKGKGGIVTLVDRKTGYLCAHLVYSRDAKETRNALVSALKDMPVKSISLDNGSEFADFKELEKQLDAPVYFAEPHKPWQRGCNENANGLLRFFFPKGCDFRQVSPSLLQYIVDLINNRPRKRFNWRSPSSLFFSVALT